MSSSDYFKSYDNYFWHWEEMGDIVAIPKSSTIAYKELLINALENLKTQGHPSFGALLLVIVATNPLGVQTLREIESILQKHTEITHKEYISDAMALLYLLTGLPEEYKTGEKKMLVFRALFRNCHNICSVKRSLQNVAVITSDNYTLGLGVYALNNHVVNGDLKPLALIHRKFTSVDEILNAITNLPEIDTPLLLEEDLHDESPTQPETNEEFVEAMINDQRLFKIGALVRMMWSGIHLPFHSSTPTQQKIGGVSDLTNKGNFDQLLISEFANPEVVFLSRLANNEALYLSRESPPTSNDLKRVILIDVSLKNWGTPKTIAFATMIAIAKHPKSTIDCEAYIVGKSAIPVNINSLNSLIHGFQVVEGCLDGANGIRAYFDQNPDDNNREVFVITETNTQKHEAIIKVMSDFKEQIAYWVFNDDQGSIDIYKELKNSRRHLQHLQLPLDKLWSKTKKKRTKPVRSNKINYYPILFQRSHNFHHFFVTENEEIFQLTKTKDVLRLFDKSSNYYQRGWQLFYQGLKFNYNDMALGIHENGNYYLLSYSTQNRQVSITNLNDGKVIEVDFPHWKHQKNGTFYFYQNQFIHFNYYKSWIIDIEGNLTPCEEEFQFIKKRFEDQRQKNEDVLRRFYSTPGILKNVKSVSINSQNKLVLNGIHQLVINHNNELVFETNSFPTQVVANWPNKDHFEFSNGNSVKIDRTGVMIIKSHKPDVPEIFIPLIMRSALGISTNKHFAGNTFYQSPPLYEVTFINAGNEKLEIVKTIRDQFQIGLRLAKEIAYSGNRVIPGFLTYEEASLVSVKLESLNCKVEINKVSENSIEQEILSIEGFYEKHIHSFINEIIPWS